MATHVQSLEKQVLDLQDRNTSMRVAMTAAVQMLGRICHDLDEHQHYTTSMAVDHAAGELRHALELERRARQEEDRRP